ncbi:Protein kinase superfamily protein [Striga hermonthica]|uniref:Protein kinase superfamily protein n=1 Tax=Striga hermonthica TaxID=68872 RepID=A0A9N7NB98_STRHE|nr:Protein kinase superfamily protein [Striga hermonthica]
MEDESTSWIRRTKFSHTVCHRFDASRLNAAPFSIIPSRTTSLISRQELGPTKKPETNQMSTAQAQARKNPPANRQRAVSPNPVTKLPETFKEARSSQRRFSTPTPRRKMVPGPSPVHKSSRSTSPFKYLNSIKLHDKSKSRKEFGWTKYFDHGGGRVTSVETVDVENMVDLSKLFLGNKFAHGAHSRLYQGFYMDEPIAMKMIIVPDDDENGALGARLEKQFVREVTLLSRLHHENVIKLVAAFRKPAVFCIITEYLPEGSLRAYLHKYKDPLPMPKLISMALDIAKGMEYIHSQGVIHRDLKPENILITHDFRLKLADFGIACEEAYCDLLADDPGTYRWMAPEMIKRKKYGRKVDVYGFGLILWELVAGAIPYEDMTPIQAAFAVVNKNLRPAVPKDCAPAMKALVEQCWSLHPDKRPEFWQIVKVLEEFDSSLALDGTLNLVQNPIFHDPKKGFLHWIQKLGHQNTSSSGPKPKFT